MYGNGTADHNSTQLVYGNGTADHNITQLVYGNGTADHNSTQLVYGNITADHNSTQLVVGNGSSFSSPYLVCNCLMLLLCKFLAELSSLGDANTVHKNIKKRTRRSENETEKDVIT